jgi:hypothetical protein
LLIEVTFEGKHLGMETQRQWSDKAIERNTLYHGVFFNPVNLPALELKSNDTIAIQRQSWHSILKQTLFQIHWRNKRHVWTINNFSTVRSNNELWLRV